MVIVKHGVTRFTVCYVQREECQNNFVIIKITKWLESFEIIFEKKNMYKE